MLEVNLQHRIGGFELNAEFIANPGSITALFGPSGSGKTTLVNLIAGLARPSSGRIVVNDTVLDDTTDGIHVQTRHRQLGYVFQDSRLFPHLSVEANLRYGMGGGRAGQHQSTFEQVSELLDLNGLLARRPKSLSGGERQRVAIGRALLSRPRMLLMDEPLASIDEARRGEILPFIERLRDEIGLSIIYVSHATEEVIRLADKVVMLDNGRIAADGTVQELMSRLDIKGLMDPGKVGAVLTTKFSSYDPVYDLASLDFEGGTLQVPGLNLPEGSVVRAQILSRDLALSLSAPVDISVLNVFSGEVTDIGDQSGPQVDLRIDVGTPLIATVTRKSLHDLKIEVGTSVYAMVKAVAIDRRSLGSLGTLNSGTR